MSLKDRLAREIALTGPMTIADYVTRCLHDPRDGYYATRPAIGATGDFITAPMISQMFGELIGLWAIELWRRLGAPERVRLVEVGPGDGTLMADALRAARLDPEFLRAVDLVLIEPSPPLREAQARMLADSDLHPRWVASLDRIETDAPVILIANEVLDCLPARQFVKTEVGWAERCVGVTDDGGLVFGLKKITGGFKRPEFDKMLQAVRGELDQDKRKALYADMATLVRDEGGMIVPFFNQFIDAVAVEKVGGWQANPQGEMMDGYALAACWLSA